MAGEEGQEAAQVLLTFEDEHGREYLAAAVVWPLVNRRNKEEIPVKDASSMELVVTSIRVVIDD